MQVPRAVTVAGSDSGGGAGIQADLKTFQAYGVYGASVLTAITAQNTREVAGIWTPPIASVRAQLRAVLTDIGADALKTGMLASAATVHTVVEAIDEHGLRNVVVDPVLFATSGDVLVGGATSDHHDDAGVLADFVDAIRTVLIPRAACVTPNMAEAATLVDRPVVTVADMRVAAEHLCSMGAAAALVTGGHLDDRERVVDVLCDASGCHELAAPRVVTTAGHGTGCTLAAAIAAGLATGWPLRAAVEAAADYVRRALAAAPAIGAGHGPVWHGVEPPRHPPASASAAGSALAPEPPNG